MRIGDYFRLGWKSVRSRKKSTRNTVWGIAFGLAVLIPVLFFTLSFYADLLVKVNEKHSMATLNLPFSADATYQNDDFVLGTDDFERIMQGNEVEEIIPADFYSFSSALSCNVTVGDRTFFQRELYVSLPVRYGDISYRLRTDFNYTIKAIDTEMSGGKIVADGMIADMGIPSVLIAGEGFTGKAGEVILSEPFMRGLGFTELDELIGKTFSIKVTALFSSDGNGFVLDNDGDPTNEYQPRESAADRFLEAELLHEFTICGIIGEDYYLHNTLTMQDAHIWLPGEAVYTKVDGVKKTAYLPTITNTEELHVLTYPKSIAELWAESAQEKMFFPAFPAVSFRHYGIKSTGYAFRTAPVTTVAIQCHSFNDACNIFSVFESAYSQATGNPPLELNIDTTIVLAGFANLRLLNTVCNYIIVVMLVFGGVVLVATLLNLFNSVNYSVQMRKNYMGMMQAIGAKRSVIPKLYFVEILLVFLFALPWAFLFGGALSYGMKYLIDWFFASNEGKLASTLFTKTIVLNFNWFYLALGIVVVALFLIAILFSVLACRGVTKKGVVEVLATEQS